jgi:hypothetical protein
MIADMGSQSLNAVCTHDEPDFESAEPASQRDLPVTIIGHQAGVGVFIAEVRRSYREGINQVATFFNV